MSSKYIFLTLFLSFLFNVNGFGQTTQELDEMDNAAFVALESNDTTAVTKANQLLAAGIKANSAIHQINAYTILGIINKNRGYYVTSVDYYNRALNVAEEAQDDGRVSACYNNIGSVYQIQENYSKAISYFKKSLEIEEKLKNPLQKSIRLYNIGEIYREMDSLTLALSNFNSSLIIEKQYNNEEGVVYALLGIADVYLQLERPTDAGTSLKEAKAIIKDDDVEISILYKVLRGEMLFLDGELDEALTVLREAKDLSIKHEFRVYLMDIYEKEIDIKLAQEKQTKTKSTSKDEKKANNLILWLIISGVILIAFLLIIRLKNKSKGLPLSASSVTTQKSNPQTTPTFKLENDSGKVLINIELDKILCFEANDNYVNIYHLDADEKVKKTMERISLKKIETRLESQNVGFKRVHKSYLINATHIAKIGGKSQSYRIDLKGLDFQIPVSRNFDVGQLKR